MAFEEITPAWSLKTGQCSSVMAPSAPKVPSFSFRSNLVILGGRPAYLSNDVGHPASGLAFGHSVCNKESSASSRTSFTMCHQDGQKLAGYVAKDLPIGAGGSLSGLVNAALLVGEIDIVELPALPPSAYLSSIRRKTQPGSNLRP